MDTNYLKMSTIPLYFVYSVCCPFYEVTLFSYEIWKIEERDVDDFK